MSSELTKFNSVVFVWVLWVSWLLVNEHLVCESKIEVANSVSNSES